MGMIGSILGTLFGGRNVVAETAEVFRPNAEAGAARDHAYSVAALAQFAAEFAHPRRGLFDRAVDGLNRLPRPAMALGVIGLFVAAMTDPDWFAGRMAGLAAVPDPLWWLLGAIVSFYFGARHQATARDWQREIAAGLAAAAAARDARPPAGPAADDAADAGAERNAALDDWRAGRG